MSHGTRPVKPTRHAPKKRLQRLLVRAEKDPSSVLKDPRCLKPHFCKAFFDLCDNKTLEEPETALDYASVAVELADLTGDPCLINSSRGVLVHANFAAKDLERAKELLDGYEQAAVNCCPSCKNDYFLRKADYHLESRRDHRAHLELMRCAEELEPGGDPDSIGIMLFLRGIVNNHIGRIVEALADAYYVLRELPLDSPRGYFLDTIAYIAWFVLRSDGSHDLEALEELEAFRERIKGLKGWGNALTRVRWVEGGLYARLGDARRAGERFDVTEKALQKTGPTRHVLAVSLDKMQLLARTPRNTNLTEMRTIVARCLRVLELDEKTKRRLQKIENDLVRRPEKAPYFLARMRAKVVSSVPGLV